MTDSVKHTRNEYRNLAKDKARSEGRKLTFIGQQGTVPEHKLYISGTPYELAYPNDPDNHASSVTPATVVTVAEYQKSLFSTTEPAPVVSIMVDIQETATEVPADGISTINGEPTTPPEAPLMQISTFPHVKNSTATPVSLSKQEFKSLMSTRHIRPDKDGELIAPATFNGSRSNINFISADALGFDFDHGQPRIENVLALFPSNMAAYYTTHSHTAENPRFRVFIPLERSVNADEHARLVKVILSTIPPGLMDCLDKTCFERARSHYLPSCPKETECHAFTGFQDGEPLNVKYFLRLADKLEAARVVEPASAPAAEVVANEISARAYMLLNSDEAQAPAPTPATAPRPEPEQVAARNYEYIDTETGEVLLDLAKWVAQNPHFDIVNAIDQQYRRGQLKDGKQHIACPFEDQHTDQANDLATFAANASPPEFAAFDVHCCHAHCAGRDRLEFIQAMLEKGWLPADQLQPTAPPALELKRPSYFNHRSLEIASELVKQPLQPQEIQYQLHLSHVACAAYDGTLPDDDWLIARILGIAPDIWVKEVKPVFIKSGWQVVENGRIFNPITLREYRIAQNELMQKSTGGKTGGLVTQQRRRDREAHLQG